MTTLAERLNRLFDLRQAEVGPLSNDDVAEAITRGGTKISGSYLWLLRNGRRNNPGGRHLQAIADYFSVPITYFFTSEQAADTMTAEAELAAAMRQAGVRELALRAAGLSADSLRAIAAMVEQARRVERLDVSQDPVEGA